MAEPVYPGSAASQRYAARLASQQSMLLQQGKLRQDYAPGDAAFGVPDLVLNFQDIALRREHAVRGGRLTNQSSTSTLSRWEKPVTIGLHFGASVPEAQRDADRAEVAAFAAKLSNITGHPVRVGAARNANLLMVFLDHDEQVSAAPELAQLYPVPVIPTLPLLTAQSAQVTCAAFSQTAGDDRPFFTASLILVKQELTGVMRKSCIQEEMAQAMGLIADSDAARPSMFNDDREFATLTQHDAALLKMLYDPRLSLGMTATTAQAVLPEVAAEALAATAL